MSHDALLTTEQKQGMTIGYYQNRVAELVAENEKQLTTIKRDGVDLLKLEAENKRLRKCLDNYCWTDEDIEKALEETP